MTTAELQEILEATKAPRPTISVVLPPPLGDNVTASNMEFAQCVALGRLQSHSMDSGTGTHLRVASIGDVHGSVHELCSGLANLLNIGILNEDFSVAEGCVLVFIGDYIDRGCATLPVLAIVARILCATSGRERGGFCFALRGNHEHLMFKGGSGYSGFGTPDNGTVDAALGIGADLETVRNFVRSLPSCLLLLNYFEMTGGKPTCLFFSHAVPDLRFSWVHLVDAVTHGGYSSVIQQLSELWLAGSLASCFSSLELPLQRVLADVFFLYSRKSGVLIPDFVGTLKCQQPPKEFIDKVCEILSINRKLFDNCVPSNYMTDFLEARTPRFPETFPILGPLLKALFASLGVSLMLIVHGHNHPECAVLNSSYIEEGKEPPPFSRPLWRKSGLFENDLFLHEYNSDNMHPELDPNFREKASHQEDRIEQFQCKVAEGTTLVLSCCSSGVVAAHSGHIVIEHQDTGGVFVSAFVYFKRATWA
ncbi:hypothetical protein Pelo_5749 [Pelomyxa schiedti]|nr:hypothetical protein Pelo_5749 [Pelomyxa schiedti]